MNTDSFIVYIKTENLKRKKEKRKENLCSKIMKAV